MPGSTPRDWQNAIVRTALICLTIAGVVLLLMAPQWNVPSEDALILHSFSHNLATTGVISWFPGGPRAEGATDFLWMVLLAVGERMHVAPFLTSAIVSSTALIAIGYLLQRAAGVRFSVPGACAIAAVPLFFPQYVGALIGFSVLPFGAAILALAVCVKETRPVAASITALALCLLRPDGVVFAVPLLTYLLLRSSRAGLRSRALAISLYFVLPGLVYMAWRVHYFHEWFPLPFYVKSDTKHWLFWVARGSARDSVPYLMFTVVCLIAVQQSLRRNATAVAMAILLLGIPTVFYLHERLDQDLAHRFFFYLPLGVAFIVALLWRDLGRQHLLLWGAAVLAWFICMQRPMVYWWHLQRDDAALGRRIRNLALDIHNVAPHGSMLVTEAGILPFYTGWTAYDAWGLNTPEFAHHQIVADDVRQLHPDVIMVHDNPNDNDLCRARRKATGDVRKRDWPDMVDNLMIGVPPNYQVYLFPYVPVPVPGTLPPNTSDYQCWYLNPAAPVSQAVAQVLQKDGGWKVRDTQGFSSPEARPGS